MWCGSWCPIKLAIILLSKKGVDCLTWLCYCCCVTVCVLCLFIVVPCIGLWFMIVVFPGHAYLFFYSYTLVYAINGLAH